MKHKLHSCSEYDCPVCNGGLYFCNVCKGGESDLPTECPGKKMTEHEMESIVQGALDFKNGKWEGFLFNQ